MNKKRKRIQKKRKKEKKEKKNVNKERNQRTRDASFVRRKISNPRDWRPRGPSPEDDSAWYFWGLVMICPSLKDALA